MSDRNLGNGRLLGINIVYSNLLFTFEQAVGNNLDCIFAVLCNGKFRLTVQRFVIEINCFYA